MVNSGATLLNRKNNQTSIIASPISSNINRKQTKIEIPKWLEIWNDVMRWELSCQHTSNFVEKFISTPIYNFQSWEHREKHLSISIFHLKYFPSRKIFTCSCINYILRWHALECAGIPPMVPMVSTDNVHTRIMRIWSQNILNWFQNNLFGCILLS